MDREQARRRELRRSNAAPDPFSQFQLWFEEARSEIPVLPEGMTLATCGADGQPQARVVLLKGVDERGFIFFTNYRSSKARELDQNPRAALNFWWGPLERQVRILGRVETLSAEESNAYFATRPRGSQIGAWCSDQSRPIASREVLEARMQQLVERYEGAPVPCPEHWGGYRVVPHAVEFWQGREDRLHDRLLYERDDAVWRITRLSP